MPPAESLAGDYYRGKQVMVTGGLGFIGSNLARRLVELGAAVVVVDALIPNFGGNRENLAGFEDRLKIHIVNLSEAKILAALVTGIDVVFNLAGQVSHLDSMSDPLTDLEANARAQIVLLEACRQFAPQARVAFASTRQIYGKPAYWPVDERHPLHPVDVNGIHKMAAEAYHTLYHEVYGLWTVSLRLTNTYGPRMRVMDARQTFLGLWLRRALEDQPLEVWGGGQQRDLTYGGVPVRRRESAHRRRGVQFGRLPAGAPDRACADPDRHRRRRHDPHEGVPRGAQAHRHRRLLRR